MFSKSMLALVCAIAVSAPVLAQDAGGADAPQKECRKGERAERAEKGEGQGRGKRGGERGGKRGERREAIRDMDADQDGKISKEEAKGRILENFDAIDADADGFLTKEELHAFAEAKRAERKAE